MKWLEQLRTKAWRSRSGWRADDAWWRAGEAPVRVEEPPFVPFDLSPLGATAGLTAATVTEAERPPATLAELGLPAELAHDFEVAFRAMGATAGGRVIGYRFRTLDGATHPIRLDDAA